MGVAFLTATRKGLFLAQRSTAKEWQVRECGFLGDPVTAVLRDSRDSTWYAALNLGHFGVKLHRSQDQGKSWTECPAPAFPPAPEEEKKSAPAVQLIWALQGGGVDEPGVLWAGTIPGGLFHSEDRGESWSLNQFLWERPERQEWFGGGFDEPGIHSICVNPQDSANITLGVSCGGVWISHDRGATWKLRADGMRAAYMPEGREFDPRVQDPHRVVQCSGHPETFWAQHHNGIFRSDDGGTRWVECQNVHPSPFGFAAAVHPERPEQAWFVPAQSDACRVPVDGRFVVTRTKDGGESFEELSRGLPASPSYDLVYRHALDVDDSGRYLAVGSTTGSLWISEDEGDSWSVVDQHLPPIYCVQFL